MSCGEAGKKKSIYTGNQVGAFGYVGEFNYLAGGTIGLSAGTTVVKFIPSPNNRRVWLRKDAHFDDKLLDAAYPTIDMQWYADIEFDPQTTFRVSDRSFWIIDKDGVGHYYDARCERSPTINATVGEWLKENYEIGDVTLVLNNRDGLYNDFLPYGDKYKQWTGVKVKIRIGFGEDINNYFTLFDGQVTNKQGLTATRDTIELKCYDKFDLDEVPLPPRTFTSDNFPDIDEAYKGKYVPLVYGDWLSDVPAYGCVNAICVNAIEPDPAKYKFKVSDIELAEIEEVYLHRGERVAGKPQGPIKIADNVLTRIADSGEFEISSTGVVLDEPYYIGQRLKAGPGSAGSVITSDNGFNFIEQGVKVGDTVVNGAAVQAKVTLGNLEFKSTGIGALGNGVGIEYYLLPPSFVDVDGNSRYKCYASLVGSTIRVGITQYTDANSVVQLGKRTAGAIKAAINDNLTTNPLVRIAFVGTVPFGYPPNTRVSEVDQNVPAGPVFTGGGQNALLSAVVTSVANFQLTVSGAFSFTAGTEFSISTVQYKFLKSDKFTVKCLGKPLNLVSTARLSDVSTDIKRPTGISLAFDSTIWISDDETQKIYNLTFDREILREIPYTAIDPAITEISGLHVANDNKLWVASPLQSRIYRYDLEANEVGLSLHTSTITGLGLTLGYISGISVKPDNRFWIVDRTSGNFYLIDAFAAVNPFVVRTFNANQFNVQADEVNDVAYDTQADQLIAVDRATNALYRVNEVTGAQISVLEFQDVAPNINFVSGACVAQDGTLVFVDQGTLSIYNYNDMLDASYNPAIICRDILQKFGAHTYEEFDLSWMQVARQLGDYRCRVVLDKKTDLIKGINRILSQYNTVLHLKFNKYALFYIHFDNFRTNGKATGEKDIKADSFKPGKEMSQYFNAANATFDNQPFDNSTKTSDTYISTAAISFAGKEYPRTLEMQNIYRRQDLDRLIPLHVRLAAPEPEFIDVTYGFRVIRLQMQDFVSLTFDESLSLSGAKSGRRFTNIPCMVRKMQYDLGAMTVQMKLWSLGNTAFGDYVPPGNSVGGENDTIVLSSLGRQGRISPVGTITASGDDYVDLQNVGLQNAEQRNNGGDIFAWLPGYRCDLIDAATKLVVRAGLIIDTVSGARVTFTEDIGIAVSNTVRDSDGFATSGLMLQYSTYNDVGEEQKKIFASFGRPNDNYPTSRTQELEEQRGGAHSFEDGGLPYILYPINFNSGL